MINRQCVVRAAQKLRRYSAVAVLGCAVLHAVTTAQGQTIVDSQGFEPPLFTTTFNGTGQLEGQTPATFNGTWLRTKGAGGSSAIVQAAVAASGMQAVQVSKAPDSDDRWGVPVSGYPTGDYICISWDMRVEQTAGPQGSFGPFFGVEAYDDDASSIGLLASLGVDATTGDVLYQAPDTGYFTETGVFVDFGEWNRFMIDLDFNAKTASYFVNATLLGTSAFVDQNNVVGGLNEFTDANISALGAAADPQSQALTGTAYYDNFMVDDGQCIPEPATGALAAIGVLAWVARRRSVC